MEKFPMHTEIRGYYHFDKLYACFLLLLLDCATYSSALVSRLLLLVYIM